MIRWPRGGDISYNLQRSSESNEEALTLTPGVNYTAADRRLTLQRIWFRGFSGRMAGQTFMFSAASNLLLFAAPQTETPEGEHGPYSGTCTAGARGRKKLIRGWHLHVQSISSCPREPLDLWPLHTSCICQRRQWHQKLMPLTRKPSSGSRWMTASRGQCVNNF